ncbi:MAG: EamA family transporter [Chloroflexi bacterium]|nr:EamA family transporter [Chloroflexota bacterium]
MSRLLLAYLMLAGASVGWGVGATMTRFAVAEIAPFTTASVRFAAGALLLLVVLVWRGEARRLPPPRDWPFLALLGFVGITLFGSLYTIGLQWTGAAEGTLIQGISPLVTVGLAALALGEPIRRSQLVGGVVAFVGLAVLVVGGPASMGVGDDRRLGNGLLLVSAICWAGYTVGVRMAAGRFQLAETSAYSVLVGAALMAPFAATEPLRVPFASVSGAAWLAIGYLAVVSSCLCYLGWNEGVRRIGAGRAAAFSFIGPIAAILSAAPLLGELPTTPQLLGGALILSGLWIANRK